METKQIEKAWCAKHLTSRPGKDQFGNWYTQCWTGHNLGEECDIRIEKIADDDFVSKK